MYRMTILEHHNVWGQAMNLVEHLILPDRVHTQTILKSWGVGQSCSQSSLEDQTGVQYPVTAKYEKYQEN